jgi:hypothetical protein
MTVLATQIRTRTAVHAFALPAVVEIRPQQQAFAAGSAW